MQDYLIQRLTRLGLSEREAAVYLILLRHGTLSVSEISRHMKCNRTTIYDIVEPLEQEGFVSRALTATKRRYRAEPPQKIPVILRQRANRLEELAKSSNDLIDELDLEKVQTPVKPKITLYEGENGIKSMYDASLLCKTEIRSFLTPDALEAFDPEYIHEYFTRRAKNKIHIRGIVNESSTSHSYQANAKQLLRDVRIVPKDKMNIVPEVYIYDDTVAIFSLNERLGLSIVSKDIAQAFRALYDLAWERADEYTKK